VNLPIGLTLTRIVAVPLLIVFLISSSRVHALIAAAIFILAAITDWADGMLARRRNQVTTLGTLLDPIADKLLVGAALFMLAAMDRISPFAVLPALVILSREILVSGLREHLAGLRVRVPVSRLAKWKTGIQMFAIGVLLVGNSGPSFLPVQAIGELLLWIAAILTLITGYDYLRAGLAHITDEPRGAAKPSRAT
jgi:cardiolipin synthase (CMP-forming)